MNKFSVLMSVYYKEAPGHLSECLRSIVNQTMPPSQIVLVKDGKLTRELDNVIAEFSEKWPNLVTIVIIEKNRGLGTALRKGVEECSYELVARVDADDICQKNRFEKQLEAFMNHPDISIVGSNITEYDNKLAKPNSIRKVPETDTEIKRMLKSRNPFNHMSVMFKKSAILEAGNYQDMPYFEDYYLWCRLLTTQKGYNIQENLMKVRAGDDMFRRRGGLRYVLSVIKFEGSITKIGIIKPITAVGNICARATIALLPVKVRKIFYNRRLRDVQKNY